MEILLDNRFRAFYYKLLWWLSMERKIFIEKNVFCPVCKNQIDLKYPNPKLYAAASREADRRVTAYTWAAGIKTTVVPHYYAVVQCPQCLFADLKENLENPGHGTKDRYLYEARQNADVKKILLLRKLRRLIGKDAVLSWEGALSLHLAAIYSALLPEKKEHLDSLKLGRLYLRLSWLFQERRPKTAEIESTQDETKTLTALYEVVEKLQGDFQAFMDDLGSVRGLIGLRGKELGFPEEGENNPYFPIVASIRDKTNDVHTFLEMLLQSVISDKKGILSVGGAYGDEATGKVQSLLGAIAKVWPDVPRTEEICVRKAIEFFDYTIKYEDTEQSIEQSLSMVNLVVKLLLKVGDLEGALDYISQIFKSGFRDKQELQRRLSQGKRENTLSEYDQRNILRKIATVNNTLQQASDTRKNIQQLIFEKYKEKILAIAKANIEMSPQQQEQAFLDGGFSEDMTTFFKAKGFIKVEEDKKGWFGKKKK